MRREDKMKIYNLLAKPIEVQAIRWENNEPEVREFIKNDDSLRFGDYGLRIWNEEEGSWINVPALHYIIKGLKGELTCESPEMLERKFNIVTE